MDILNLRKLLLAIKVPLFMGEDQQNTRVCERRKQELYKTALMGHAVDCWAQTERRTE